MSSVAKGEGVPVVGFPTKASDALMKATGKRKVPKPVKVPRPKIPKVPKSPKESASLY